jgi:hypothetical protein
MGAPTVCSMTLFLFINFVFFVPQGYFLRGMFFVVQLLFSKMTPRASASQATMNDAPPNGIAACTA